MFPYTEFEMRRNFETIIRTKGFNRGGGSGGGGKKKKKKARGNWVTAR